VIDAINRGAPGTDTRPVRRGRATLVVRAGTDQPVNLVAAAFAQRRQAHLTIGVREETVIIGPLVPPDGTPCLNCLELHRQDRDPLWPVIAAQLAGEGQPEPCTVPTLLAAVAYAATEVLTYVDGGAPGTVGAAVEIGMGGQPRRRAWPPHPACDCVRQRRPRR
jgi:bacteriocin biosynthesis cyclodehydratase domain-containing protein